MILFLLRIVMDNLSRKVRCHWLYCPVGSRIIERHFCFKKPDVSVLIVIEQVVGKRSFTRRQINAICVLSWFGAPHSTIECHRFYGIDKTVGLQHGLSATLGMARCLISRFWQHSGCNQNKAKLWPQTKQSAPCRRLEHGTPWKGGGGNGVKVDGRIHSALARPNSWLQFSQLTKTIQQDHLILPILRQTTFSDIITITLGLPFQKL